MKKNTSETDEYDQSADLENELDEPKELTQEQIEKLTSLVTITRRKTNEVIRLCPHCVFSAVKIIPSYANFMIPSRFFCPKCDWQGPIALEATVSDIEQYLKDNPIGSTKTSSEDNDSGFCSHCGKEHEPGKKFCPNCGKERD
ncbi:MAG: zinc ribbon domain-containing protein [Candidatus Heimdallarchaeota archaeon]|nr:zinc ribbon domain-containing protein [Candidatus Heimdallarchaeota archaeon]MCK5049109.1 zinc ribbon domain-containing protein [Candidatus Heimdallarchaeota archaeon]